MADLVSKAKGKQAEQVEDSESEEFQANERRGTALLTKRSRTVRTLDQLLETTEVDLSLWEVERWVGNKWDCVAKVAVSDNGGRCEELQATELWQVKAWFRRKADQTIAVENLLEEIKKHRDIKVPRKSFPKSRKRPKLAVEIAIMDPHMGLDCRLPGSDQEWNEELCEQFYLYAVDELIRKAKVVAHGEGGEITEIVWPFGNDFIHTDNVQQTTTAGTPQPEAVAQHQQFLSGEKLAIAAAEQMIKEAPVVAYQIPGNHDRYSSYCMGRVLNAYYHANDNFTINASCEPFKRWRFGTTLLGFEHGHSINAVRMAGLMANEWREDWADTHYHEWHCGDQHRKGSSKPSAFEEQGVSVEFLAGLVAPNEWHRLKSFNFQKRAANAFVWHYDFGQIDRVTVNISKYTGNYLNEEGFRKWKRKRPSYSG